MARWAKLSAPAEYALLAYETAWTDGPPFVWWWRLERARQALEQLDVPLPDLPPFDEASLEQVPYEDEIYAFIANMRE